MTKNKKNLNLIPEWVPGKFKDIIKNESQKKKSGLGEIMAAEIRVMILQTGDNIIKAIKEDQIHPNYQIKKILENLVLYWKDPISYENDFFNTYKRINNMLKINSKRGGIRRK